MDHNNNGNKLYFYQEKGISMTDVEGDRGGFNEFEVIKSKKFVKSPQIYN